MYSILFAEIPPLNSQLDDKLSKKGGEISGTVRQIGSTYEFKDTTHAYGDVVSERKWSNSCIGLCDKNGKRLATIGHAYRPDGTVDVNINILDDGYFQINRTPVLTSKSVVNNLTTSSGSAPLSAAQGKILNDKLSNVGALKSTSNKSVNVSSSGEKFTKITEITLPAGTWIITGFCQWDANSNGVRAYNISTESGLAQTDNKVGAAPSGVTTVRSAYVFGHSSEKTYYLNAYQNSGSLLSVMGNLKAVRII